MNRKIVYALVTIGLFVLMPTDSHASLGRLRQDSVKFCASDGKYYGQHASDNHWHTAVRTDGQFWNAGEAEHLGTSNPCFVAPPAPPPSPAPPTTPNNPPPNPNPPAPSNPRPPSNNQQNPETDDQPANDDIREDEQQNDESYSTSDEPEDEQQNDEPYSTSDEPEDNKKEDGSDDSAIGAVIALAFLGGNGFLVYRLMQSRQIKKRK